MCARISRSPRQCSTGELLQEAANAREDNQLKQKLIKLIENLHLNKAYLQAYFTLEFQSKIREQSLSVRSPERSPLWAQSAPFSSRPRATGRQASRLARKVI